MHRATQTTAAYDDRCPHQKLCILDMAGELRHSELSFPSCSPAADLAIADTRGAETDWTASKVAETVAIPPFGVTMMWPTHLCPRTEGHDHQVATSRTLESRVAEIISNRRRYRDQVSLDKADAAAWYEAVAQERRDLVEGGQS